MDTIVLQTPAQLATQLRSLRKARGLTQAQLGAQVGVDQTRMAKIERDPRVVSVGQLLKIFAALKVRVVLDVSDLKAPKVVTRTVTDNIGW